MEKLPAVVPSSGHSAVSPDTILTRPMSTSSSSAHSCVKAVRMPCPSSTLPVSSVTVPSALMRIHASSLRFEERLPGRRGACD
jgi:hypothetical protein